jgi:hypothetical protein
VVVVVVLPLLELVVENLGVVDQGAVEEAVELLAVDAVGSLSHTLPFSLGVRALIERCPTPLSSTW